MSDAFERHPLMKSRGAAVSRETASTLLSRVMGRPMRVLTIRKLYGGSLHRVREWVTDAPGGSVVAKLNNAAAIEGFRREAQSLAYFGRETALPVPRPLGVIEPEAGVDLSGLLMEKVDAVNLADARLSPAGYAAFQHQLAELLIALHQHQRDQFGSALSESGHSRWLDVFRPSFESEYATVRSVLTAKSRWFVDELMQHLDRWLPEGSRPTLVHGDLWANNILVDDAHPDAPRIMALIDGSASFCDPEYELAYLRMFQTVDATFFEVYQRRQPLRKGFESRCRVYWLKTLMMHVRMFGDTYIAGCEEAVGQLRRLSR